MVSNKIYRNIYYFVVVLFIISSISMGIYYFLQGNKQPLYLGFASLLFIFIPVFFNRIKVKIPYRLLIFLFVFLIISYTIGLIMDGYKNFASFHYDKIVHFISGFLFTMIGLCGFFYMNKSEKPITQNWVLGILFALFFSMFTAVLCEFYEYIVSLFGKSDPQLNITTGVADTMKDFTVCLLGSMITIFFYALYFAKGFKLNKESVIHEFCELNDLYTG